MTILSTLLGRGPRAASLENPALPLTSVALADWLAGGLRAHSGKRVNERTALGIASVWRAVNLLSGTCAGLPLHPYKSDGAAPVRQTSGMAATLLSDPHPDLTPFELWELGYGSLLTWGNTAYLKVRDGLGAVQELWWVEPSRIKYGRAQDGTKVYVLDGDTKHPLTDREVLHIPGFGYDGVCGVSAIRAHREGLGLMMAAEEFGARFFGNGSLATGILTTEQRLDPAEADKLKDRWKANGGVGLPSAHDIRVLGSGAKFQQLTIPPGDAQFIESRKFGVLEVARIFGVPPHMLMETEKSTSWGKGIEEQTLGFVTYTLAPWLNRFEQRLTKHVLAPGPVYAKYSLDGLLRGNTAARMEFYRGMWDLGALSTNEIRALEEREPVPGGDRRWRPMNFAPLDQVDVVVPEPAHDQQTEPAGGA